jgi:hypothetical protein
MYNLTESLNCAKMTLLILYSDTFHLCHEQLLKAKQKNPGLEWKSQLETVASSARERKHHVQHPALNN